KTANAQPLAANAVQQQAADSPNQQNDFDNRYNVKAVTQRAVQSRAQVDDLRVAIENAVRNGENWFTKNPVKPARSEPTVVNLSLAWAAALLALLAVGLGGWTLIDLSQRRIRFVSAVTHELRTPLTTLRLYLDMLTGGMIQDERQKAEYLQTLHAETDRLNR